MEIMQGDAYDIPLKVTINDLLVTPESVEKIEACIGSVSKIFPDHGIAYDEERQRYLVSLEQEDTFGLKGNNRFQVRIQVSGGDVIGVSLEDVYVNKCVSKEVL